MGENHTLNLLTSFQLALHILLLDLLTFIVSLFSLVQDQELS